MDYETKADPLDAVFEEAVPAVSVTRPVLSGMPVRCCRDCCTWHTVGEHSGHKRAEKGRAKCDAGRGG